MPGEDLATLTGLLEHALTSGEPYEAEIRIKPYGSQDESFRWHLLRALPMRSTDGIITHWVGTATDVHDRRLARDVLRVQLDQEHHASVAFQNAAMPKRLPAIPGVEFDAIYEPSGENILVGGDWYDVFRLPDGRVVVSVGDVIGNGLNAAVTMAAARQSIRGAAQVFPEPAAVLDAADRALRSDQPERIVTAFLGIFDPVTRAFSYASAGHPPPLLRDLNGLIRELAAVGSSPRATRSIPFRQEQHGTSSRRRVARDVY